MQGRGERGGAAGRLEGEWALLTPVRCSRAARPDANGRRARCDVTGSGGQSRAGAATSRDGARTAVAEHGVGGRGGKRRSGLTFAQGIGAARLVGAREEEDEEAVPVKVASTVGVTPRDVGVGLGHI